MSLRFSSDGKGTSASDIRSASSKYGRIMVGFDSGALPDQQEALAAAKEVGAQLSIYVEGPGGPTGNKWSPDEAQRVRQAAKSVGIDTSRSDWMRRWDDGGWKEFTFKQLSVYAREGWECAEIDNLDRVMGPSSKALVAFVKEYATRVQQGKVPRLLLKNIDEDRMAILVNAVLNNGGEISRTALCDWHISEQGTGDRRKQGQLSAKIAIRTLLSDDTFHYSARGEYGMLQQWEHVVNGVKQNTDTDTTTVTAATVKPQAQETKPKFTSCQYRGNVGQCKDVAQCSGTTRSGLCPGGANIKCCFEESVAPPRVEAVVPIQLTKCTSGGRNGVCMDVAQCSGTVKSGLCPGAANIKCCLQDAAPTTTRQQQQQQQDTPAPPPPTSQNGQWKFDDFIPSTSNKVSLGSLRTLQEARKTPGEKGPLYYRAGAQIDVDGSGPHHGDPWAQSQTSLRVSGSQSVNADETPYFVLPPQVYQGNGIKLGDLALLRYRGKTVAAVFADVGPRAKIGEISRYSATRLGIPNSPVNGGTDSGVEYLVFPKSGRSTGLTFADVTPDAIASRLNAHLETLATSTARSIQDSPFRATTTTTSDGFPTWGIAVAAVGGAMLLAVIVVIIVVAQRKSAKRQALGATPLLSASQKLP